MDKVFIKNKLLIFESLKKLIMKNSKIAVHIEKRTKYFILVKRFNLDCFYKMIKNASKFGKVGKFVNCFNQYKITKKI